MSGTWSLALVLLAIPATLPAQQIDMAAVQKWSNVKVVRYQVSAEYRDWTQVASYYSAQGDVTDSFTAEFDWDVRRRKLIGKVTFKNGKSSVKALRDLDKCATPVLKGEFEHFEIKEGKDGGGSNIALVGTRSFPAANVATECPASKKLNPTPAKQEPVTLYLGPPDPKMMAVAGMPTNNPNLSFTADKKSFVMKDKGWTLTYTPTPVQ